MTYFVDHLQLALLVFHEEKIHDVIHEDIRTKATRKWDWCLSSSIDKRFAIDVYLAPLIKEWSVWCIWKCQF